MVKGAVPKPIENIPGPSHLIPNRTSPISPTESKLDIERGLNFGPGEKDDNNGLEPPQEEEEEDPYGVNLTKLCQERGVKLLSVRATPPYCSQRDSASYLARPVPLVTSGRLIPDC